MLDATLAESIAQREALWQLRESVPEAQRHEGASIKHDVSVPVAALPAFLDKASAAVARVAPTARLVAYGHVGDGNLHFNLSEPAGGADRAAFLALQEALGHAVHACVREFSGASAPSTASASSSASCSRGTRTRSRSRPCARSSSALDPRGIMNPGKVLPD